MQITWKISYVFSCSTSGSAPPWWAQGDEGVGIAGGWEGKGLAAVVATAALLCQRHACIGRQEMPCWVTAR